MKKVVFLFAFMMLNFVAFAQLEKPIKWSYFVKRINKTEAILYLKAKLDTKWHMYAQGVKSDAMRLKFSYASSKNFKLIGKTIEPKPIKKYDKIVKMDLAYFENEVVFQQKIKLIKSPVVIKAKIEFMVCNDRSCLPADEITLNIPIN
ncbi:protein-disulfide reductase DsbD domain-containing protein [Pedobacter sp. UC225_61]|uniref:protein-disulfide reductase DsbD domain-containing protein n=1 Tax=Pedobacter sp. UC225_61 TaxID=3374623 RepID=UPI0037872C89